MPPHAKVRALRLKDYIAPCGAKARETSAMKSECVPDILLLELGIGNLSEVRLPPCPAFSSLDLRSPLHKLVDELLAFLSCVIEMNRGYR